MSVWDTYEERINASGKTRRERVLNQTKDTIARKIKNSLSHKHVLINGVSQEVTITDTSDGYDIKEICTLPDYYLEHGGLVEYANSYWLITSINSDSELYSKGKIERCNYLLKWLDDKGNIIEKWCIVEDGTKYLIGEKSSDLMNVGDARLSVTISKDIDTNKLSRGRRFLIDDLDTDDILAYQITKPNKLYNINAGKGVFRFILNEVNRTSDDNVELRIADYYSWKKPDTYDINQKQDISLEEIIELSNNQIDNTTEGRWI